MMIDPIGILVLAAMLFVFYLLPSTLRLWRPFLIAAGIALAALALFWLSAFVGPIKMEEPRGLGAAIDLFLRMLATSYLLWAFLAQGVRAWALRNGHDGYKHWITVLVIGMLAPLPMAMFI